MPPKGNEARAAALGEIAALLHRMRTDPSWPASSTRAEGEALDDVAARQPARDAARRGAARTRCPRRWCRPRRWPTSRCEHAWRTQRPANDWAGFLANLREVAAAARARRPRCSPTDAGLSHVRRADGPLRARHDARAEVDRVFGDRAAAGCPGLVAQRARAPGDASRRSSRAARSRRRRSARCASA